MLGYHLDNMIWKNTGLQNNFIDFLHLFGIRTLGIANQVIHFHIDVLQNVKNFSVLDPFGIMNGDIPKGILGQVGSLGNQILDNFHIANTGSQVQGCSEVRVVGIDIISLYKMITSFSTRCLILSRFWRWEYMQSLVPSRYKSLIQKVFRLERTSFLRAWWCFIIFKDYSTVQLFWINQLFYLIIHILQSFN